MIPESKLKISFQEMALRGAEVLAKRPKITFAQAVEQAQRLQKNSKVNSSLKKSRESA
jgi:hypothetical protein